MNKKVHFPGYKKDRKTLINDKSFKLKHLKKNMILTDNKTVNVNIDQVKLGKLIIASCIDIMFMFCFDY